MPGAQATQLGTETALGGLLIANGTSFAAGTSLVANFNVFGTVASGGIAILPLAEAQAPFVVFNGGANALLVDPQAAEFINAGSVGVGFSVTAGKGCLFYPGKNTSVTPPVGAWIANMSL
jgi:hypothetical protein